MRRCTFYLLLAAVVASVSLVVLFATSPSPSPLPATTVVALLYPLPSTPSGFLASLSSLLSSEDEAEDAVDCGTLPYCTLIARTSCGWCWDDGTARRGGHRGDVQGTCRDWTWQVTQCSLHVLCSSLASCQGIVGTTCGWCAGVGGMRGGVSGPQSGACAASAWIFDYTQCPVLPGPQQVHLMYGEDAATMVVTWSSHTNSSSLAHVVDLDVDGGSSADTHSGDVRSFTHNNAAGLQWVHRVNVTGLLAGHRYVYWVQSDAYASSNFSFTALTPAQPSDPHRFVVYGDMGRFGGEPALSAVQAEVLSSLDSESPVTAVLHLGDFAYDMLDFGGANGDAFMARIEPIAARVPYVTTPGNHETEADSLYSHYRHRFTMPGSWAGDGWRLYFSFNAGLIHFLSYNTEALFAPNPLDGGMQQQLDWLRDDLERANRNRQQQPWIVAFGHRPMVSASVISSPARSRPTARRRHPPHATAVRSLLAGAPSASLSVTVLQQHRRRRLHDGRWSDASDVRAPVR